MNIISALCRALLFVLILTSAQSYAQVGTIKKINGDLAPNTQVGSDWQTSQDGRYVVYAAQEGAIASRSLHSVSLITGRKTRISGTGIDPTVDGFTITNDGQYVVFVSTESLGFDFSTKLFVSTINGTMLTSIDLPAQSTLSGVRNFAVSPDGANIVYTTNNSSGILQNLYSVPISGGASTLLHSGMSFGDIQFVADGTRLVYRASLIAFFQGQSDLDNLFAISINGGDLTQLTTTSASQDIASFIFRISPDQQKVVFITEAPTTNAKALFSVNINGTDENELDQANNLNRVANVTISPDSASVIFTNSMDNGRLVGLYSAPIGGGAITILYTASDPSERINLTEFQMDGSAVFFDVSTELSINGQTRQFGALFRYKFGQSSPLALLTPFSVYVGDFALVDANQLLVSYGPRIDELALYIINLSSGAATQLSDSNTFVNESNESEIFILSPEKDRVYLIERVNGAAKNTLNSVQLDGTDRKQLSAPHQGATPFFDYQVTSTGEFLIYYTDQDTANISELFAHQLLALPDNSLCIPIKTKINTISIVCL